MSESDAVDCKTCGACCTAQPGVNAYVPVTALDRRRLPTKYQRKVQDVEDGDTPFALGLKRFAERYACVALKGTLGKDISCDVYSQRPDFCRALERGGDECLSRRRETFFMRPAIVGDV
jgi:Fe-S-cluster containining protein